MSALIEFRQVCKYYELGGETIAAADHISMEIRRGEFVAIVGQSGSGKSTCMNIIGCLDISKQGSVVTVDPARLAGSYLKDTNVRYYALNQQSEISVLILNDATGDTWSYAYLLSVYAQESENGSRAKNWTYAYLLNGAKATVTTGTEKYEVKDHSGVALRLDSDGKAKEIQSLVPVSLTHLGALTARSENKTYDLAENLQIYLKQDNSFYLADRDAVDAEDYTLTGYYDNLDLPAGGLIRIILAEKK